MAKNIITEIHEVFESMNTRVRGPVTNLHGIVDSPDIRVEEPKEFGWYVLSAETDASNPSLSEFVNAYTFERGGVDGVSGSTGSVRYRPPQEQWGQAVLFFAQVRLSGSRQFPIEVRAPGYEISFYVDYTLVQSGGETLETSPTISEGLHHVAVMVAGGEGRVEINTSPDINLFRAEPVPPEPIWAEKGVGNYLDAKRGVIATRLAWNNDPFSGAWNVYRSLAEQLEKPTTVTDQGDGTYEIDWQDNGYELEVGEPLFTKEFLAGNIVEVDAGFAEESEFTTVLVEVDDDAPVATSEWLDSNFYHEGEYSSVASVNYAGEDTIRWDDTNVTLGEVYTYKVTALGFIELLTESNYSDMDWILAADTTPPSPITVIQELTERNIVRITYLTSPEPDFVGVHVYGPYTVASPAPSEFPEEDRIHTEWGVPNSTDQVFFRVDETQVPEGESLYYYLTPFDASENEQPKSGAYEYEFDEFDYLPPNHVTNVAAQILSQDPTGLDVFPRIEVTWTPPADERYDHAEIRVSINAGPFRAIGTSDTGRFEWDGYWDSDLTFRVIAVSKWAVKADPLTADPLDSIEAEVTTDAANSAFMTRYTETEQYAENRPPNGEFYVLVDDDDDATLEEWTLTDIGTLTIP